MKRLLFLCFTVFCLLSNVSNASNIDINKAYQSKQSDVQVQGIGKVIKVLKDDTKGSRHQKFLLKLSSNLTVLVAHNIDLSRRVADIKVGDSIEFYGEYEWNNKGGVLHWTHHDPRNKHVGGWLKHNGIIYQ
ncbi:DUF3465 domain-containing protein [Arcobacter sp. s6]|jgi:hypothetical protein|uniref:DUF3465 domain-containing protein n=1 Tax=Arcobacter sp. s6 TaxID=3230363 RepID=UPI0034A066BD